MPLIESKSDDRDFATLDWATQNFYWTLRTHLDPKGRTTGDPDLLVSILFPRKRGCVRVADITRWLTNCKLAGVLRLYTDSKSRPVIEVPDAVQSKMRHVTSEYEDPPGQMALGLPDQAAAKVKPRPKSKVEKDSTAEVEEKRREGASAQGARTQVLAHGHNDSDSNVPTWEEVQVYAGMHGVPDASVKSFYDYYEGNNLWLNRYDRLVKWQVLLKSWAEKDRSLQTATAPGARGSSYAHSNKTTNIDRNAGTHNVPTGKYAAHVQRKNQTAG